MRLHIRLSRKPAIKRPPVNLLGLRSTISPPLRVCPLHARAHLRHSLTIGMQLDQRSLMRQANHASKRRCLLNPGA
jgi:hypothetical protein